MAAPDALTQAELEQRRQERLLQQFAEYLAAAGGPAAQGGAQGGAGRRLHGGLPRGRYGDILAVGRKLPKRLLEDSPDIFDFIDIAEAKVEG